MAVSNPGPTLKNMRDNGPLGRRREGVGTNIKTFHVAGVFCVFRIVNTCTLCYAIVLPARKSAFRAGLWPDCYREGAKLGPPTGLRPAEGPISVSSR